MSGSSASTALSQTPNDLIGDHTSSGCLLHNNVANPSMQLIGLDFEFCHRFLNGHFPGQDFLNCLRLCLFVKLTASRSHGHNSHS